MCRVGPLSPRFEQMVLDRLVRVVAVDGVVLLMPGLCGPGRVPAAWGRAVALRVEPLSNAQRLAPDGLPPLTRNRSGRRCRRETRGGPFPCPRIAGPDSFTLRVNEARLANWPACRSLRCAPLGVAPARSPPRSPRVTCGFRCCSRQRATRVHRPARSRLPPAPERRGTPIRSGRR